jgi:hypothetical protein
VKFPFAGEDKRIMNSVRVQFSKLRWTLLRRPSNAISYRPTTPELLELASKTATSEEVTRVTKSTNPKDIELFADPSRIQALRIEFADFTSRKQLEPLISLAGNLVWLEFPHTSLKSAGWGVVLPKMVNLQALNLGITDIEPVGLSSLTALPHIQKFSVRGIYGFCQGRKAANVAELLPALPELRELDLGNTELDEVGWREISKTFQVVENLRRIDLSDNYNLGDLEGIGQLANLESLRVRNCERLGEKFPPALPRGLKDLDLGWCGLTGEQALRPVMGLEQLEYLDLTGNNVTFGDLEAVKDHPALRGILLAATPASRGLGPQPSPELARVFATKWRLPLPVLPAF